MEGRDRPDALSLKGPLKEAPREPTIVRVRLPLKVTHRVRFLMLRELSPPPEGGVVVMGPGVSDGEGVMTVREIFMLGITGEGELDNLHPRKTALATEPSDLIVYETEVFCDQRELSKMLSERMKK